MATEDFSKTVTAGSEEWFDKHCSPCFDEGVFKDGVKYCVDCDEFFCETCVKNHDRFLKGHEMVDKSKHGGIKQDNRREVPTDKCLSHQGKVLDMYCDDHRALGCAACIAISHRTCAKVDYLPNLARGVSKSKEYTGTRESLQQALAKLTKRKHMRLENLENLDQDKSSVMQEIDACEEEMKLYIRQLAEKARDKVREKYEAGRTVTEKEIALLETASTEFCSLEEKMSVKNETKLFVYIKETQDAVNGAMSLMTKLDDSSRRQSLAFSKDDSVKKALLSIISLGKAELLNTVPVIPEDEICQYTATQAGKYKIQDGRCSITSMCILDESTLLVAEFYTKSLIRLDIEDFSQTDQLCMESFSYGVCCTGPQEVAVALYRSNKIQFVSVADTMALTRSFKTDSCANGVAYSEESEELFVSNDGNKVTVYNKDGGILKIVVTDEKGHNIFIKSDQIYFNQTNSNIYITDNKKGLLAFDSSLRQRWVFGDAELFYARGLCVLPGEIILGSGYTADNVIQVDQNGRKIGTLIGAREKLNGPQSLVFDKHTSRLFVGHASNKIYVYTLCPTAAESTSVSH